MLHNHVYSKRIVVFDLLELEIVARWDFQRELKKKKEEEERRRKKKKEEERRRKKKKEEERRRSVSRPPANTCQHLPAAASIPLKVLSWPSSIGCV
jgi:hypothetical protein